MALTHITVRGAREHNLQNVDVDIPRDKLVVLTGLSGSGKSSLAFDTIYADGQRRYVESLSAYARQFLEMMHKPDVDLIEGLSPAISIEQKTTSRNPRSTVGTVTEIYDYLRLLYARCGIAYSPATGKPIESMTISKLVDSIMALGEGKRLLLLAPIARGKKGEFKKELASCKRNGYQRARVDGTVYEIDEAPSLDKKIKHNIEIVVDRLIVKDNLEGRLAQSLESAVELSGGLVIAYDIDSKEQFIYSTKFACPVSGFTIAEIEPRLFSFNSPFGACTACDGLGTFHKVEEDLVVPDQDKSLASGAIRPWASFNSPYYRQTLEGIVRHFKSSMQLPWSELSDELKETLLYGTRDKINFNYDDGVRNYNVAKPFEGVVLNLERRFRETDSNWSRDEISKYMGLHLCEECKGARLRLEALAVKLVDMHIGQICEMPITKAQEWFVALPALLTDRQLEIGERILKEINNRLGFLIDVGLDYLTLGRGAATLSGGEGQRIRLASQIGSGLTSVLYVLDEPSIGLHQRDNARLLATLQNLRDAGNCVLVVEHDEESIRLADYVVDLGPGAGVHGGKIVCAGLPSYIEQCEESITGQYLSGKRQIAIPTNRRKFNKNHVLEVIGATGNNLLNVDVAFPLACFVCVTGVSGSGKSSLIIETLYKALSRVLMHSNEKPKHYTRIKGLNHLDKVIDIDQSPIGRTPRSNPATYTGVFGPIRDWFSNLPEANARGYTAGRFSFNVKGGRCEACQGGGLNKIEMHFLPDVFVQCEQCKGQRYNRETLEVRYKNKSIADVLDMTISEACIFFKAVPTIRDKLVTLEEVGLGYIKTGQSATTLSGGEAQRVKLSKELSKRSTGRTMYILDEPTTGLHFEDIRRLLEVLHRLVEQGNSIVVIEHNLDVIKTADWVIDVGPEGGVGGGQIVHAGTPESLVKDKVSHTGNFLKNVLKVKTKN